MERDYDTSVPVRGYTKVLGSDAGGVVPESLLRERKHFAVSFLAGLGMKTLASLALLHVSLR